VYDPARLGGALAALLKPPVEVSLSHVTVHMVTVEQRLKVLRGLLRKGSSILFDDAVKDADRVTVAVTIWALLELYKQGEATWEQEDCFGEIRVVAA
jgi:segregation and condensation protein A